MKRLSILIGTTACMLLLAACGGGASSQPAAPDMLAAVGTSALTRSELASQMPSGLSEADSTAFARAYIRQWIEGRLIEKVASAEVDMTEIDRLTREYRQQLIMVQYRREMARKATDGLFAEDSLRAYYDAHADEFVLERPLIKGIYIKVPYDARNLATLRRLYKSDRPADIDRLEKEANGSAVHYDYFRDRWIDWEQIETRIPADIDRADIAAGHPAEFSAAGFVYLLNISDYLPAGTTMPFEAAREPVRDRLLTLSRLTYDRQLRTALFDRALSDGTLRFASPNPLK